MFGRDLGDGVESRDGLGGTVDTGDGADDDSDVRVLQTGNVLELDPGLFRVVGVGESKRGANKMIWWC